MQIEAKDIIGWGITGSIGLLGLFLNWQTRRDARRKAMAETNRIWSLQGPDEVSGDGRGALMYIRVENPAVNRFRLLSLSVKRPRRSKVAGAQSSVDNDGFFGGLQPGGWVDVLDVGYEIHPNVIHGETSQTLDYGIYGFFVEVPTDSSSRNRMDRVLISATAEEVSSARSAIRLKLKSKLIKWTMITAPSRR